MRPSPAATVMAWVEGQEPAALYTTAITVAEVGYGLLRLPDGRGRSDLVAAANAVFAGYAGRVLPFDAAAAGHYGDLVVARERAGRPIAGFDAQVAAICRAHGAALATRNTSDFDGLGLSLVQPWGTPA
jgi:predicted nucleic acid-binding protein